MSIKGTFNAMKAVIEAEGYQYLKHYRQDFYEIDRDYLVQTYTRQARYLWVVRESGTHLVNLGVHPKMSEAVEAVFSLTSDLETYIVEDDFVRNVSMKHARQALSEFRYGVKDDLVSLDGMPLARLNVEFSPWSSGPRKGRVSYSLHDPKTTLTRAVMVALIQIAQSEVVLASQSLFTATDSIVIDGQDLYGMVAARAETIPMSA